MHLKCGLLNGGHFVQGGWVKWSRHWWYHELIRKERNIIDTSTEVRLETCSHGYSSTITRNIGKWVFARFQTDFRQIVHIVAGPYYSFDRIVILAKSNKKTASRFTIFRTCLRFIQTTCFGVNISRVTCFAVCLICCICPGATDIRVARLQMWIIYFDILFRISVHGCWVYLLKVI